MVTRLALLQVDNPLAIIEFAHIALADCGVVAEALRRVAADKEDIARNIAVTRVREIDPCDGTNLRLGQIDALRLGRQHAEFTVLEDIVTVQTLLACSPHYYLQLLDMATDSIYGVVFRVKIGHKVVIELHIDVREVIASLPIGTEVTKLHREATIILHRRVAIV